MFLRRYERRGKRGKRTYWALVESVRHGGKSRQKVVAYLGDLSAGEQNGWTQLGRKLSGKERPTRSLFDPPHYDEPVDEEPVLVDVRRVRMERLRDFGDVWLALGLWRLLGLDVFLESQAEPGREDVPWPVVAAILSIARFCEPASELHIETTWYRRTALEDLLEVPVDKVHTDRLYDGLDWLLPQKAAIEKHLKERLGNLFDLKFDLLLYDVTSTYFEGACVGNSQAKRGYSRDSRPDCLQVCIGLVVTEDGIPLGYEVFAGNRHDSTTVEEIVEAMEAKYGQAARIWVMDRGMTSEKNLAFLRQRDGKYIVGTPKALLRNFEEHLTRQDWHEVQQGVEVQLLPGPEGKETFVLARSADRRQKEKAMHDRFLDRLSEGCYLLRTNLTETDPATLWKRYIQLTEAEWAFRITKDELELRPIWHHKEKRVQGHILVCFLAYVMWKSLGQWMRRAGLGDAPRTVLEELAKVKSGDVLLPTRSRQGNDRGTIRLRCVTEPDEAQKVILHRLGISLPRRLRRIDELAQL